MEEEKYIIARVLQPNGVGNYPVGWTHDILIQTSIVLKNYYGIFSNKLKIGQLKTMKPLEIFFPIMFSYNFKYRSINLKMQIG